MKQEYFLSQRLGFTNAQADKIKQLGVEKFVDLSMKAPYDSAVPDFFENAPKTRKEFQNLKSMDEEKKKLFVVIELFRNAGLSRWWVEKMYNQEFPLREKMVLFWHNHFVSSFEKVKSSWAMYNQNMLFRDNAFGNFKELTRLILYDNAMIMYLDNIKNRKGALNENLSRELLELFTLGVGNYTEQDIKEGAKALAGLNLGEEKGKYYPRLSDDSEKTYLGKKGNLKADDMVEAIFAHPKAAHRITEKLLKYFVSDTPKPAMIDEYATFLKQKNYEIKPFLLKMSADKRFHESQGAKIKDPLSYVLQVHHEFQLDLPSIKRLVPYFKNQSMMLLQPPNVKGWDGGKSWLSSQKLLIRMNIVNLLSSGKNLEEFAFKGEKREDLAMEEMKMNQEQVFGKNNDKMSTKIPEFRWDKNAKSNKDIIKSVSDRLLFAVNNDVQQDMERILKYDFNPTEMNAQLSVTRLAEYVMKTPEFQIF
jgi:uncharacterized protein (DUF1800 family)